MRGMLLVDNPIPDADADEFGFRKHAEILSVRLARLAEELAARRHALSDYAEGIRDIDPADPTVLRDLNAAREVVGLIYGQRLTLVGEKREPSGPIVAGQVDVDRVAGQAVGVKAEGVRNGMVEGIVHADQVEPGGEVTGVEVRDVGRRDG
jgi:hypothetical protein